jgi:chitodextrinase
VLFGQRFDALTDTTRNEADSLGVLNHQVKLINLNEMTQYYFQVRSGDFLHQTAVSTVDSFRTRSVTDDAPPFITEGPVEHQLTPTSATIVWETDKHVVGVVQYSTTELLEKSVVESGSQRRHRVTLSDLQPNSTYYYRIWWLEGRSALTKRLFTFTTPSEIDHRPPVIVNGPHVDSYGVSDTTALITWRTDTASNSRVVYWELGMTDTLFVFDPEMTTEHTIILTHLKPDTPYRFFVQSTSPTNNQSAISRSSAFRTRPFGDNIDFQFIVTPYIPYRSDTRVIFEWLTNIPSDGYIYYVPLTSSTGGSPFDAGLVRGHSDLRMLHRVNLGGLKAGTAYAFLIFSSNPRGDVLLWPPSSVIAVKPALASFVGAQRPSSARMTDTNVSPLNLTGIQEILDTGNQFVTNIQPDQETPRIISGPVVISQMPNQIILVWETDELGTSEVHYGKDSSLGSVIKDTEYVGSHQMTLTNLDSNTVYYFQVSSTDPSGNRSDPGRLVQTATRSERDITPPVIEAPSIASIPSDQRALIRWTMNEPAVSEIAFGPHPDSLNTTLSLTVPQTDPSVTITGLVPLQTYYYKLYATDLEGNGPTPSATYTFTTLALPDTTQPVLSDIQATTVAHRDTTASITVIWQTDRMATTQVFYGGSTALDQSIENRDGALAHTATITGLLLNTAYYLQIGSTNINDTRSSAPVKLGEVLVVHTPSDIDGIPPSAPLTAVAIPGNAQAFVRWQDVSDVSGISGYEIHRNGIPIAFNVTDTMYYDQTVINGVSYQYEIAAIDRAGNVGHWASTTAITPDVRFVPTTPVPHALPDTVSLKPILIVDNAQPVTEDASRSTLTYTFQVAKDALFTDLVAVSSIITEGNETNPTHWQILDPGRINGVALTSGVQYWWRARAKDGVFDGPWSAEQSFIASASVPTAVELASFTASDERGVVRLNWIIAREEIHAGFHVYRRHQAEDPFEQLTGDLLTGQTEFEFIDSDVRVNHTYYYRLEAVEITGEKSIFGPFTVRVNAPKSFSLEQNYPNPFNPVTTIRFDLPQQSRVTLQVYNILGQEVVKLIDNELKEAGFYTIQWNGRNKAGVNVASGVYLYRLSADNFIKVRKMILLK